MFSYSFCKDLKRTKTNQKNDHVQVAQHFADTFACAYACEPVMCEVRHDRKSAQNFSYLDSAACTQIKTLFNHSSKWDKALIAKLVPDVLYVDSVGSAIGDFVHPQANLRRMPTLGNELEQEDASAVSEWPVTMASPAKAQPGDAKLRAAVLQHLIKAYPGVNITLPELSNWRLFNVCTVNGLAFTVTKGPDQSRAPDLQSLVKVMFFGQTGVEEHWYGFVTTFVTVDYAGTTHHLANMKWCKFEGDVPDAEDSLTKLTPIKLKYSTTDPIVNVRRIVAHATAAVVFRNPPTNQQFLVTPIPYFLLHAKVATKS